MSPVERSAGGGGGTQGTQLDYVERTTNLVLGAEADWIVGNSVTYDGTTRIKLEAFCANIDMALPAATTGGGIITAYDGVTALNRITDQRQGISGAFTTSNDQIVYGVLFLTPTAGAHTFKVTALQAGGGTITLTAGTRGGGAGTYAPAFLRITRA